ncbi:MAG TPA: FHA domain-containing serine/threonine-protein kinase [Thermoanaerobaculia bacterium]|nr:FHA domain-containing serine/threonine-protein kinase [Thermoanaerobaculia bacterium]
MKGKVIGNYRIERELGEGGMSHVYLGVTIQRSQVLPENFPVVLKIMSDELAGEETARKRFIKEAQILAKLRHRYITRFFEFLPSDTNAVLVMEYVEGEPVDEVIRKSGALPVHDAISIAQSLLEALVYAHGKGIIHRDIKPANLMRQPSGSLKVTDFGIAKMKEGGGGSGQTVLTKSGFLLGTPHYMSPEQIREPKDAGPQSDVYSVAVVLYEMLTGCLPFNSRSLPKLIDAIYRGEKQGPSQLRPEINQELEAIVLKGMHPRQSERYPTARHFYEALEEYGARPDLIAFGFASEVEVEKDVTMLREVPAQSSTPVEQRWQLVSVRDEAEESHEIKGENVMIGRDRSCGIVLSHPAVSRRHARITHSGTTVVLEDLKSANGTYVNNARIDTANLKPGDVVRFGADPACSYVIRAQA